jgi:hypothetical protein
VAPVQHRCDWRYLVRCVHPTTGRTVFHPATSLSVPLFHAELAAIAQVVGASPPRQIILVLHRAGWRSAQRLRVPDHVYVLFLPRPIRKASSPAATAASKPPQRHLRAFCTKSCDSTRRPACSVFTLLAMAVATSGRRHAFAVPVDGSAALCAVYAQANHSTHSSTAPSLRGERTSSGYSQFGDWRAGRVWSSTSSKRSCLETFLRKQELHACPARSRGSLPWGSRPRAG